MFEHLVESGKIAINPVPSIKFKVSSKIKAALTEPQAQRLLTAARDLNSPWYPIWLMALYTGMRSGELYALKWDRVNFETCLIKVDTSWNSKDGFKSTKSGDDRIIPISPSLMSFLKELKLSCGSSEFVLPHLLKWKKANKRESLGGF